MALNDTTSEIPEPNKLHRALSLAVIAECMMFIAGAMGEYFGGWQFGELASFGLEFLCPVVTFFLALGIGQFRDGFVKNRKPGNLVTMTLVGVAFISAIFCFASYKHFREESIFSTIRDSAVSTCSFLICSMTAVLNFRLRRAMARFELMSGAKLQPHRTRFQFSLRNLLLAVTFFGLLLGIGVYTGSNAIPTFAEHVIVDQAPYRLPRNATDITYRTGPRGTYTLMFTIDEPSFRTWMNDRRRDDKLLQEIVAPVSMRNFTSYFSRPVGNLPAEVNKGLHYWWSYTDKNVQGIFDRDNNRAYYHYQSY